MTTDPVDYQTLFESLPGCYLALKPDLVIVAVSAGLEVATGRKKHQLLGKALGELVPAKSPIYESLSAVLQSQAAHEQTLSNSPLASASAAVPPSQWRSKAWPIVGPEGAIQYVVYSLEEVPVPAPAVLPSEEEQFRRLANMLPLHVWTARADGELDYLNNHLVAYTGVRVEELGPQNWLSLVHPEDESAVAARWQESLEMGCFYETQMRVRGADGAYRWFLVHAQPQREAGGKIVRWYGTSTDMEEQHQLRQQLLHSDQHLQQILSQVPAQIATLLGPDHVYGFINEQAQHLLGPAVRPGMVAALARPSLVETGYLRLVDQVYRTGEPFELSEMPSQQVQADGTPGKTLYFDGVLRPLTDKEGQIKGVLVFGLDVTERVRAKQRTAELMEEVREQDRQFEQVMEGLPQMVWVSRPDGHVTYYNHRWYDYTGSNFEEMQGWGWEKWLHPDDYPTTARRWQTAVREGSVFETEHRWRDQQGGYRWFLARSEPVRAANGAILRWVGTNTDIDEQKRFQQHLAAKDEQLHQILRQSPALIATLEGPDHRYAFTNPGYDQFVSYRARLGRPVAECLPELAEQGLIDSLNEVYRTGTTLARQQIYVEFADTSGQRRPTYLDFTYQPLRGAGGQIQGVLAFIIDVTEQVQVRLRTEALAVEVQAASVRLVEQRETFYRLFQQTPASIAILRGPEYRFDYFNAPFQALFPTRDLANRPLAEALPEAAEQGLLAMVEQAYHTGETGYGNEVSFQVRNATGARGKSLYFNFTYQAFQEEGAVVGVSIFAYDVTEQVKTRRQSQVLQAKISRRDRELRMMAESLPQITFVTENDGRLSYSSPQWYAYTGQQQLGGKSSADWFAAVYPADLPAMQQEILAATAAVRPWRCEFRLLRHDGYYRWHLGQGVPDLDLSTGQPRRWFGSSTDIHELRELQEQLVLKDQQLQQILSQVPAYIATVTGPEHRYSFTNSSYDALMGGRIRLGRRVAELLPELAEQGFVELLDQVYHTNAPYVGRETLVRVLDPATGSWREHYLDFVYQPLYDAQGQAQGILGFGIDVTEQVRARQQTAALQMELRGRDEQFRFLAESIPQIVWTAGADGQVDYFNQRLWEVTGRHTHESLGESAWLHIIHPDDQARTRQAWQEAASTGSKYEIEYRFVARTGGYRWFLGRAEPLRNPAGEIIKWFGSCTDIDDFKQAQQRLQTQNNELLRINKDLDNFVYTASHDLRQPIYNMAGIFEELTRTIHFPDPDAAELIAMFEQALQRIYATIQDLADIVQVQRRHEQVPAEPTEVLPLLQAVIRGMQDQVEATGAKFELDTVGLPTLWFVRSNLQSILYNLLSNALKYAAPGRPPRIRVRTELLDGVPVLTVADNGLGIDLERYGTELFQMFRRFHDHVPGSGMGLHLVQRLVQQAGGRLEVESVVGEGTTFRLYLQEA